MPFTVAKVQEKMLPWIQMNIPKDNIKWLYDAQLLDHMNQVAEDLNSYCQLHVEKYYKAATAGETNYTLDYEVLKLLKFIYKDSLFTKQKWVNHVTPGTDLQSVLVLKTAPTSDVLLDIIYHRKIVTVSELTDEVDLPDVVFNSFIDLLKQRLSCEYAGADSMLYEQKKIIISREVYGKVPSKHSIELKANSFPFWETDYDITDFDVGVENLLLNESTQKYEWVGYVDV